MQKQNMFSVYSVLETHCYNKGNGNIAHTHPRAHKTETYYFESLDCHFAVGCNFGVNAQEKEGGGYLHLS